VLNVVLATHTEYKTLTATNFQPPCLQQRTAVL